MKAERVRVGDVLELQRREVAIDPTEEYRLIGIYSFGKGILHREPKIGSELGDYRFYRVLPGDLVLSNIQSWEGAIAYATQNDLGTIGTHRFLTYTAADDRIDTSWARWFFLSELGMDLIRSAAPGTTMRNRTLAIQRFENLEIPLPPIDEQREVANRLDRWASSAVALTKRAKQTAKLHTALFDAAVAAIIEHGISSGWPLRSLAEVAEINPRPARLDPNEAISFVPMSAVDARTGSITAAEDRFALDIGSGYKQFIRGDVIFARITPCMQNGKSAIFNEGGYAYGSSEFFVARPGKEISARWLHTLMRTHSFRRRAAERFTGTAGQQRVPVNFLRTVKIPLPSLEQQNETVAKVGRLEATSLLAADRRRKARALLAAVVPSAMNDAFANLS